MSLQQAIYKFEANRPAFHAQIFHVLLPVLAFLLPFTQAQAGHTQWTSLALILLSGNWLFTHNYRQKRQLAKQNPILLWLTAYFFFSGISLLWSSDPDEGLRLLTLRLGMVAFPVILFTTPFSEKTLRLTLKCLVYSTLLATILTFRQGFAILANLKYLRLNTEEFTLMHRVYLGLLLNFCLLSIWEKALTNRKVLARVFMAILFTAILAFEWIIAAKMPLLAVFVSGLLTLNIYWLQTGKKWFMLLFALFLVGLFLAVCFTYPDARVFVYRLIHFTPQLNNPADYDWRNSMDVRRQIWLFFTDAIKTNRAWFAGVGIGDSEQTMRALYCQGQNYWCENMFNAHNQYLNEVLRTGIPGLFLLLAMLLLPLKKAIVARNYLAVAFTILVLLSLLTENLFDRVLGLLFCTLVNTILTQWIVNNRNKAIKIL